METIFDFLSVVLFIATAGIFFLRIGRENPPLAPYLVICIACAVANQLGNADMVVASIILLVCAAFLLLQIASEPYSPESDENAERRLN